MHEEWRPVPGYEGTYSVSNLGNVRREAYLLKRGYTPDGYPQHNLCKNKTRWTVTVHRLVAMVFLGEKPSPEHEVNHKDRVKENCRLDNLEYLTPAQNVQHSFSVGTRCRNKGVENPAAVLTEDQVREIRRLSTTGVSTVKLGKMFGISQGTAWRIKQRITWRDLA